MLDVSQPGSPTLFSDLQAFLVDAADHTAVSHIKSVAFVGNRTDLMPCGADSCLLYVQKSNDPAHLLYSLICRPFLWTLQTTQQSHTSRALSLQAAKQSCCPIDADSCLLDVQVSWLTYLVL